MKSASEITSHFSAAIITGGSSGIGLAFLENLRLADKNFRIWNLSRSIPEHYKEVPYFQHISADLEDEVKVKQAFNEILKSPEYQALEGPILLVNNAGFGVYGRFLEAPLDKTLSMMDLNMRGLVHGTGILLESLREHGGTVVNVASTASFQPTPYLGAYGATKSFVLHWSLALNAELQAEGFGKKLWVSCVCPGPTETSFFKRAGLSAKPPEATDFLSMQADEVVDISFKGILKRKPIIVCGWKNKLISFTARCGPKVWVTWIAEKALFMWRNRQIDK
ncbi:MAG: SDR family NAD(P)-dependent oxidoreductase [Opitutales bacterium]